MAPLSPQPPNLPPIDFGLEGDRQFGTQLANAKIALTRHGFHDRYSAGVQHLWRDLGASDADIRRGNALAAALLEERRKTLIRLLLRSGIYAGVTGTAALVAGFGVLAIGVLPVSILIAVYKAKHHD